MSEVVAKLKSEPLAKVARATDHIDELERRINDYLSAGHWKTYISHDVDAGIRTLITASEVPIPPDLPFILGDAIHNLRSALDIVMFSMISGKPGAKKKDIGFPISASSSTLEKTLEKYQVKLAGSNVLNAVKGIQPYRGGDDLLSDLHELDIADKHHVPLMVVKAIEFGPAEVLHKEFGLPFRGEGRIRFTSDTPITQTVPPMPYLKILYKGQTLRSEIKCSGVFRICFGNTVSHINGEEIVPLLRKMTTRVSEIVNLLIDEYVK